jgi:hypothetical protein
MQRTTILDRFEEIIDEIVIADNPHTDDMMPDLLSDMDLRLEAFDKLLEIISTEGYEV